MAGKFKITYHYQIVLSWLNIVQSLSVNKGINRRLFTTNTFHKLFGTMKIFNSNHGIFSVSYTLYTFVVILNLRSHFAHIEPFSNIEKFSEGRHHLCYEPVLREIETEDLNDRQLDRMIITFV